MVLHSSSASIHKFLICDRIWERAYFMQAITIQKLQASISVSIKQTQCLTMWYLKLWRLELKHKTAKFVASYPYVATWEGLGTRLPILDLVWYTLSPCPHRKWVKGWETFSNIKCSRILLEKSYHFSSPVELPPSILTGTNCSLQSKWFSCWKQTQYNVTWLFYNFTKTVNQTV